MRGRCPAGLRAHDRGAEVYPVCGTCPEVLRVSGRNVQRSGSTADDTCVLPIQPPCHFYRFDRERLDFLFHRQNRPKEGENCLLADRALVNYTYTNSVVLVYSCVLCIVPTASILFHLACLPPSVAAQPSMRRLRLQFQCHIIASFLS